MASIPHISPSWDTPEDWRRPWKAPLRDERDEASSARRRRMRTLRPWLRRWLCQQAFHWTFAKQDMKDSRSYNFKWWNLDRSFTSFQNYSITALGRIREVKGGAWGTTQNQPFEFAEVKGHKSMTPKQLKAPSQMVAGLCRFFFLGMCWGWKGLEGLVDHHFSWQKTSVKELEGWRKKTQVKPRFEIHFLQKLEEEKQTPQPLNKCTPEV